MTPGPASLMVTELPRKSPTPIAPPMVIMVSWRCVSARLSWGELPAASAALGAIGSGAAVTCLSAANHVTKYLPEFVNLLDRVVVNERRPVGTDLQADPQALHQSRGVHVAVTNSDAVLRHGFCNQCRRKMG